MAQATVGRAYIPLALAALLAGCGGTSEPPADAAKPTLTAGTALVESHGYAGCVRLFNDDCAIVLEPNVGGRVLEYSLGGRNVIYVDPSQDGWFPVEGERVDPTGGRCDVGPEVLAPRRPQTWLGRWDVQITGDRSARLISQPDSSAGIQLIRDFTLAPQGTRLEFTQTIVNTGTETQSFCHWSRTFVLGNGILLMPLEGFSRYPRGFVMFDSGSRLAYRVAETDTVRVRDGFFEITGPPPRPKFGVDSRAGWLGYITRTDLLMVKRWKVETGRVYGDVGGITAAAWYNRDIVCELEPLGPMETLAPGEEASFTEDWWLFDYAHPGDEGEVDLGAFEAFVDRNAR